MSDQFASAVPPVPPAPARRTGLIAVLVIVTAVIALGLGLLVGWAVFGGDGGSDGDGRGEANLEAGCVIVERLADDVPLASEDLFLENPEIWEIGGAGQLFVAASYAGAGERWTEPGRDLMSGIQRVDLDLVNDSIETLIADCADR